MKIGELAQSAQCTVETIRYYEKEGLLPEPARTASNYRRYDARHLERLCFIRNCRALDMSHKEIQAMLSLLDRPSSECDAVNELLDEHIEHVSVRMRELLKLKEQLIAIRQRCHGHQDVETCGILRELTDMEAAPMPDRHSHLG